MRIVVLTNDLMDRSRISAALGDVEFTTDPVRAEGADVVVVDLRLGRHSGLTVLEAVRALGLSASVALLTSYADPSAATEALRAGARGFLLKDTGSAELVDRLRAVAAGDVVVDGRVAQTLGGAEEDAVGLALGAESGHDAAHDTDDGRGARGLRGVEADAAQEVAVQADQAHDDRVGV